MTKKEKMLMSYLCSKCQQRRTYLISPQEITQALSKKYVLSIEEIDDIMQSLNNESFIDYIVSDSKKGYYYCVNLKQKGFSFNYDIRKNRRAFGLLVLRSMFLATVSFVFGVLLKAIFKN